MNGRPKLRDSMHTALDRSLDRLRRLHEELLPGAYVVQPCGCNDQAKLRLPIDNLLQCYDVCGPCCGSALRALRIIAVNLRDGIVPATFIDPSVAAVINAAASASADRSLREREAASARSKKVVQSAVRIPDTMIPMSQILDRIKDAGIKNRPNRTSIGRWLKDASVTKTGSEKRPLYALREVREVLRKQGFPIA